MSKWIKITGAKEHNLKNISLKIPREKLVVISGLSGSGKSSLAFDTIYAEGQRRYVESLSAYARQFLGQLEKPDVDVIEGLSPAISIEQKTTHRNPRSTVGTVTEIYDYLRLMFARIGIPHCPKCGKILHARALDDIVESILNINKKYNGFEKFKLQILSPIVSRRKGEFKDLFASLVKEGFIRARIDGEIYLLEEAPKLVKNKKHSIEIVVDRLVLKEKNDATFRARLSESVELALSKAEGKVLITIEAKSEKENLQTEDLFSTKLSCHDCDIAFPELTHRLFSFNSPDGACQSCSGLGANLTFHPELLIKDKNKSINQGIIKGLGWSSDGYWYKATMTALSEKLKFSLDTPWSKLPKKTKDTILNGDKSLKLKYNWKGDESSYQFSRYYEGIIPNLLRRYSSTASDAARTSMEQYMVNMPCDECGGARLKKAGLSVTIQNKNIQTVTYLSLEDCLKFFKNLNLKPNEMIIAKQALKEVLDRLNFLNNVGVGYLSLDRMAGSLSGGEAQRIRLATQIGSALMGVLYVLDEPSIGLHQSDNARLIKTLLGLRDLGNSVIVVEHDEETLEHADYIIDMGLGAGEYGGEVIYAGSYDGLLKSKKSLTGQYLSGRKSIAIAKRKKVDLEKSIFVQGASQNNLKSLDVKFPLSVFTCVTGLSGSGKSTLVNQILHLALSQKLHRSHQLPGKHKKILGIELVDKVININQSPIGRTPRSNPATYTGAFTPIREFFSKLPASKVRGYKPGRFSFNVSGGRCEACDGDGVKKIEMHFLSDVYIKCEICHGKRFNLETLEVKYKGLNISDVLALSIEKALVTFENIPAIKIKLQSLVDVGLGYIRLGQAATTLSGGEAQRVKLATELSKRSTGRTVYILDEPTTGLHFEDIRQLLVVLHRFVDQGNTVIVIEHNMDVIKTADYIIDLGPEGGAKGGQIVALGTPEEVAKVKTSSTGKYLKKWLKKK